jgi:hypothetical protein
MKFFLILLLSLIMIGCKHFGIVNVIPPVDMTQSAITETFVRIDIYARQTKKIPPSLDVLPKREGYANSITDGWNRPLLYRINEDGVITLTSLGKDGKVGGTGDDADISKSYYTEHKDGSLWIGEEMWIVQAEVRK